MNIEKLLNKISKIRAHSEVAWDGCADDPRFQEGEAGEAFDRDREKWEWEWDAAEAALAKGRLDTATEHLGNAQSLEADYGDDSFARSAIAIVRANPIFGFQTMTAEESSALAVRAGIYTPDGQLAEHYRDNGEPSKHRPRD